MDKIDSVERYRWSKVEPREDGPGFVVLCLGCTARLQSGRQEIWADLLGQAYVAYYCDPCKRMIEGANG